MPALRILPRAALAAFAFAAAGPAAAQEPSPYAGHESRAIKALSEDQVRDYLDGEGMGFALAAELNRHPGPRHVLDLADSLGLDADRRAAVRSIMDAMKREARDLGAAIVELEGGLDRGFAEGTLDAPRLEARVAEIAGLQGRLRAAHLRAHLETRALLTPHQVAAYDRLRGYGGNGADHTDHSGHR